ncbi:hypothetical protein JW935_15470 [candidate division KSB1 bacterium]|nr:hypothetical protein [candidate division KSB1 bacterium]
MKKTSSLIILLFFSFFSYLSSQETFGLLWEPVVVMDNQLFPSYIWANSTRNYIQKRQQSLAESERLFRGDPEGQLGITFTNLNQTGYRIKVVIECNDIMNTSSYETYADEKLTTFEVFPEIDYKWENLRNNLQPRPVTLKFNVFVDGKPSGTQTKTVTLQSVNECPFTFIDRNDAIKDLSFMFAAYVNETHPRIANEILPEIIDQGMIGSIVGYQGGMKSVYDQVFAVWHYLKSKKIVYSSLSSPALRPNQSHPLVISQYVRTLDDALNTSQVNCVDGTVAMASIIYRMGIHPIIVFVPGHCFLGFVTDPEKSEAAFLETTLLGHHFTDEELETASSFPETVFNKLSDLKSQDTYRSFLLAVKQGQINYLEAGDNFNSFNLIDEITIVTDENRQALIDKLLYRLFLVNQYRQEGLLPIAGN